MNNKDLYICLSLSFFEDEGWLKAKTVTEEMAKLDLLRIARRSRSIDEVNRNGKMIKLGRGQLIASERFLAKRWGWSPSKVRRFLVKQETKHFSKRETKQGETVITICKYDDYVKDGFQSEAGNEAESEAQNEANTNTYLTNTNITSKGRASQIKKETHYPKGQKKENPTPIARHPSPPSWEDFKEYAIEKAKGYEGSPLVDMHKLRSKYDSWVAYGWKTGKGKLIKNWNATLLNTLPYLFKEQKNGKHTSSPHRLISVN